ncbi:hypothetical protein ABFS82_07G112300 [Erythranthe guttata]|uniref:Uncharacterized protein n=1 Tax=Erythranthe guttata TaxID=4155 RepID=A0A022R3R3_ERYGU|nr:PREDICTED: pelargonidin 3-O-(6-caffeoylglucoside) 5-O-(6-O-malonylglucoside) 4'''-malonyltransferase-like [Erythranthe guttata]EYU34248.1 hypothetical protein MIMGU_mgv1a006500mg [Erythranthe guttata]|eukprot:XP_012841147.1 PREDICTED: pelargonidin 3-O-(6-caffeoylglucoside) 5-O-(6-O-malonylglucoside) 4'''-malonyltransferase-like [Erythranthe guttata]
MKIKIVSKKLIKPSTPTPQSLSKYKISFIDELMPQQITGTIFFYYPILSNTRKQQNMLQLAESLSEILQRFYPLAGRYIKKDGFVDCSDQGVEFVEAQAVSDDVDFDDIVSKMEMEELNKLLSRNLDQVDELPTDPLLSIQVTEFKCGGLAIGVSVAHRIFDGYSFGIFMDAWSNTNNNNNNNNHPNPGGEIMIICPSFDLATLFPGYGPSSGLSVARSSYPPSPIVKRFAFSKDAITSVRSKLIQRPNSYYSRVRVVCAVIAKALIGVDRAKLGGKSRPCLIGQAVNMRGRTNPPMHKYSCGNFVLTSLTQLSENIIGVQELADNMGDSVRKTVDSCAEILSQSAKLHSTITETFAYIRGKRLSGEVNGMYFTDWSKFGLYDVDFGWGKPVGAGIGGVLTTNVVRLVSNKEGDGIEAWVHLNFNDMAYFEQDRDIKLLAT